VKYGIVAVTLLIATGALASGQQSTPVSNPHKASFDWLFEGTQWLDEKDQIKVTKALTPEERKALIEAISVLLRPGRKIGSAASEKKLLNDVKNTNVKLVDLNGDGIPEVIAQGSGEEYCSPTGNCDFWVFMRSGNGYKLILNKGAVQTFAISSKRTNGFNDLVLGRHGSAFEKDLFIYRFADRKYRLGPCYSASWESLVGDEWQELKNPIISPCNP
jgi:hypothetical protein